MQLSLLALKKKSIGITFGLNALQKDMFMALYLFEISLKGKRGGVVWLFLVCILYFCKAYNKNNI